MPRPPKPFRLDTFRLSSGGVLRCTLPDALASLRDSIGSLTLYRLMPDGTVPVAQKSPRDGRIALNSTRLDAEDLRALRYSTVLTA